MFQGRRGTQHPLKLRRVFVLYFKAKIEDFQKRKEADLVDFLSIPQGRRALIQEAQLYRAYEEGTLLEFDVVLRDQAVTDLQNDVRLWVEQMDDSPVTSRKASPSTLKTVHERK